MFSLEHRDFAECFSRTVNVEDLLFSFKGKLEDLDFAFGNRIKTAGFFAFLENDFPPGE